MQTFTVVYESVLSFHFLPTEEINHSKSVLVQIYSTYRTRSMLEKIAHEAQIFFPNAVIVGISTYGTIYHKTFSEEKTIISITAFEKTRLTSFSLENIERKQIVEAGALLAKKVLKRDTKLLLLFSDGLKIDADGLLEGITSIAKKRPVTGTLAGDHEKFFETFVIHDGQVMTKGAVLVALNSPHLDVTMDAVNLLHLIGPDLHVTSSDTNRVYEFNGMISAELYAHYLGDAFVEKLPRSGLEIALVNQQDDLQIARNITAVYEDGSLQFAGHVEEDSHWKFGYIDTETPFRFCPPIFESDKKIENYFLFCDVSQPLYNKEHLYRLIDTLSNIADTVGSFGYGQFCYKNGKNVLLNQSIVVLGLTETEKREDMKKASCQIYPVYEREETSLLSNALSHLSTVMFEEFELQKSAMQLLMEELPYGVIVYDKNLRLESFNKVASKLLGLEAKLASGKELERLDTWIVALLKRGFREELYTQVGRVIDPLSGENITLRINTLPITHDGTVIGAMAIIHKENNV